MSFVRFTWAAIFITIVVACGRPMGRNVFGDPKYDELLSKCQTDAGVTIALYINLGGGAAVGTSWSITSEQKPQVPERQILYSDYKPAFKAIRCSSDGFDLDTSTGTRHFSVNDIGPLRTKPQMLREGQP